MADQYRPSYGYFGPPPPPGPKTPMYHFQGNQGNQGNSRDRSHNDNRHPPSDFKFRSSRPKIAERPLLRLRKEPSPELYGSVNEGAAKFREVDGLTDSEAEDMEVSDTDDDDVPITKRAKIESTAEAQDVPKWSNPDPYTALPPVGDAARKHKDVVKLIRKARVAATPAEGDGSVDQGEDFISFDFDDGQDAMNTQVPAGTPTGPRADNKGNPTLGKRKRAADDDGRPSRVASMKREVAPILREWRCHDQKIATPWFQGPFVNGVQQPLMALHTEILDFHEWVKPRDFEHSVRSDLIHRIETVLRRAEPGSELRPFGSFAAGLYLPTGDMDLVLLSSKFLATTRAGRPFSELGPKRQLYNVAKQLEREGIPAGPCIVIAKAKVPIIKFVDRASGLKVDLSFNNDSGIIANETFRKWRAQCPVMPIIVSIVKQFLMIRGLNDVSTGGLGGFSVICLVTSLLQHLPPTLGTPNLGRTLIEFFNLYGNLFNREEVAIRMEPPGYVNKAHYKPFRLIKQKVERLAIVDPNRPENDISGGSHNVHIIFSAFSQAYEKLKTRLETYYLDSSEGPPTSLLGEIIGGDFRYYEDQRRRLQQVYDSAQSGLPFHPLDAVPPPPPPGLAPSMARLGLRPPPPPLTDFPAPPPDVAGLLPASASALPAINVPNQQSRKAKDDANAKIAIDTGGLKSQRRALRFHALRQDIPRITDRLTIAAAIKLGGYKDSAEMQKDLQSREDALRKSGSKESMEMLNHIQNQSGSTVKKKSKAATSDGGINGMNNSEPSAASDASKSIAAPKLTLQDIENMTESDLKKFRLDRAHFHQNGLTQQTAAVIRQRKKNLRKEKQSRAKDAAKWEKGAAELRSNIDETNGMNNPGSESIPVPMLSFQDIENMTESDLQKLEVDGGSYLQYGLTKEMAAVIRKKKYHLTRAKEKKDLIEANTAAAALV